MQIQKINAYSNQYLSNKGLQPSAKNPNFGMKLNWDEENIVKVVGRENLSRAKEVINRLSDGLGERFRRVFRGHSYRDLFCELAKGRDTVEASTRELIPEKAIPDWDIELRTTALKYQGEPSQVAVAVADKQYQNGTGEQTAVDVVEAMEGALHVALDKYAGHKIFMAFENSINAVLHA